MKHENLTQLLLFKKEHTLIYHLIARSVLKMWLKIAMFFYCFLLYSFAIFTYLMQITKHIMLSSFYSNQRIFVTFM